MTIFEIVKSYPTAPDTVEATDAEIRSFEGRADGATSWLNLVDDTIFEIVGNRDELRQRHGKVPAPFDPAKWQVDIEAMFQN